MFFHMMQVNCMLIDTGIAGKFSFLIKNGNYLELATISNKTLMVNETTTAGKILPRRKIKFGGKATKEEVAGTFLRLGAFQLPPHACKIIGIL